MLKRLSWLIFILVFAACGSKIRWEETYEHQLDDAETSPLDVSMLRALLPSAQFKVQDIKSKLAFALPKEGEGENYVFIGEAVELDSNDVKHLKNFLERGNTAFISSKYISKRLLRHCFNIKSEETIEEEMIEVENQDSQNDAESNDITAEEEISNEETETVENETSQVPTFASESYAGEYLTFNDSTLKICSFYPDTFCYTSGYYNAVMESRFPAKYFHFSHYFKQGLIKDVIPLGNVQGEYNNFLMLPYGKGRLILHSMPILFTNVELQDSQGKIYIEKALSHLKGEKIYWDKANQTSINNARRLDLETSPFQQNGNNILKYVMGHDSLAYAWFTLLGIAILFLIFGTKRRQRIIPVLVSKKNNTLSYLQALGRLYFFQQNNTGLAQMQIKHFMAFIRHRYGISTTTHDSKFITRLAQKSNIEEQHIKAILDDANYVQQYAVDEVFLIGIHKKLEHFYKNCRK